ncbi:uncharacterized protein LOC106074369 [Biomphalaria glabrata]|uniref:Uncharacterized protein LOC106074369 n=1 Tax=Biomphalaria glabrata TaxID=6526 RepID=A0A9W2ZQ58_BIOGL|nr:uncharacterized protein LOC106074369 [Biomphalaria glabrata]
MGAVLENIGSMREQLNSGLGNTNDKIDAMDSKTDVMESGIKTELLAMNQCVQAVEERITNIDEQMNQRVDAVEKVIDEIRYKLNRPDETLQELETDIERLAHLPDPTAAQDILEVIIIDAFIDELRDPKLKKSTRFSGKRRASEARVYALSYEAVKDASGALTRAEAWTSRRKNSHNLSEGALHLLTEQKQFIWTTECQQAFERLKNTLASSSILAYPIPGTTFILDTDASGTGIGAVLSQKVDETERVIAYFSRSFSKAERNYCVTRRELLAVVDAIKHFHKYLCGQTFTLRSDLASLQWLLSFKSPEGQVARWIERLKTYDFEIQHQKGQTHQNADALSRRPCKTECKHCRKVEEKEAVVDCHCLGVEASGPWSDEKIREDQLRDEDLAPILLMMEDEPRPDWQKISDRGTATKAYWAQWDSLKIVNGVLSVTG